MVYKTPILLVNQRRHSFSNYVKRDSIYGKDPCWRGANEEFKKLFWKIRWIETRSCALFAKFEVAIEQATVSASSESSSETNVWNKSEHVVKGHVNTCYTVLVF